MTVTPTVGGGLGMIPKDLEKWQGELNIRGRRDSIQTTATLKITKNLEKSWRPAKTCHSYFSKKCVFDNKKVFVL